MSYTAQIAQIKTVLEAVSGIANVYDYPRYSDDQTTFNSLFLTGTTYHWWWIERVATPGDFHTSQKVIDETYEIHGYYGWDDANSSYKTFQGVVDDVLDALNALTDATLSDTGFIVEPAFMRSFQPFTFESGPLLHQVVIELRVKTDEST